MMCNPTGPTSGWSKASGTVARMVKPLACGHRVSDQYGSTLACPSWHTPPTIASVEISLTYDMLGNRLRAIGGVGIEYDRLGSRASRLGDQPLSYDRLGNRLRAIGDVRLEYDRLGTRPRTLGSWQLEYDRLGNRLKQLGPNELTYDGFGTRIRTIGPLSISYDRLGTRPDLVSLPEGMSELTPDLILALFTVLYLADLDASNAS
jgi:hypothetical protein